MPRGYRWGRPAPDALVVRDLIANALKSTEHGTPTMKGEDTMLYMIIESFKDRDAIPVYRRFRDHGRLAPDGLEYLSSWVTTDLTKCYQVMECEDPRLLERWIAQWSDLTDFEVLPVITSAQAAERIAPRL